MARGTYALALTLSESVQRPREHVFPDAHPHLADVEHACARGELVAELGAEGGDEGWWEAGDGGKRNRSWRRRRRNSQHSLDPHRRNPWAEGRPRASPSRCRRRNLSTKTKRRTRRQYRMRMRRKRTTKRKRKSTSPLPSPPHPRNAKQKDLKAEHLLLLLLLR